MNHGNTTSKTGSALAANMMVFVASAINFLQIQQEHRFKERKSLLVVAAFALHLLSGLSYMAHILIVRSYL